MHRFYVRPRSTHGMMLKAILALRTHPRNPFVFASASRDHTIRIYSLALHSSFSIVGRSWPVTSLNARAGTQTSQGAQQTGRDTSGTPDAGPVVAGLPHGGSVPKPEGYGMGKCICILQSSSALSEGHQASVLDVVRIAVSSQFVTFDRLCSGLPGF